MEKKIVVLTFALLIALGAGCSTTTPEASDTTSEAEEITATETVETTNTATAPTDTSTLQDPEGEPAQAENVKEFTVEGGNFTFSPANISVKKGDTVHITFKNIEGFHDLKIDEFSVATKQLQAGGEETIEFVADKTGTFEYYCTVGKHREMGMVGTLTVTE